MQIDFVRVLLKKEDNETFLTRLLPAGLKRKWCYGPSKIQYENVRIGSFTGINAILPMNLMQFEKMTKDITMQYLKRIEQDYDVRDSVYFFAPALRNKLFFREADFSKEYMLLYLPEIMNLFRIQMGIREKTMHVILIDSGDWRFHYAFSQIYSSMNHLSVVTDRQEKLSTLFSRVLEENGLAVKVISPSWNCIESGDIIINLSPRTLDYTEYMQGNVLDFSLENVLPGDRNRTGLQLYSDLELKCKNSSVGLRMISRIFYKKDRVFERFTEGAYEEEELQAMKERWKAYMIEIEEIV